MGKHTLNTLFLFKRFGEVAWRLARVRIEDETLVIEATSGERLAIPLRETMCPGPVDLGGVTMLVLIKGQPRENSLKNLMLRLPQGAAERFLKAFLELLGPG
ncbi:hypothetical protein B6U99_06315 [Candidatus Geothermarchaeota archaeon ex4572_27]|nr:MAG: hypothetical protein B6U99_06315 [Candidatus Geothermarchaeota archaeon ex4572_27]